MQKARIIACIDHLLQTERERERERVGSGPLFINRVCDYSLNKIQSLLYFQHCHLPEASH